MKDALIKSFDAQFNDDIFRQNGVSGRSVLIDTPVSPMYIAPQEQAFAFMKRK